MFTVDLIIVAKSWKLLNCPTMDKQNVVYPYNELLYFSNRKEPTTDLCNNMDESQWLGAVKEPKYKATDCSYLKF